MTQMLILTAFVLVMAYLQASASQNVLRYNTNLTSTQNPRSDKGVYLTIAMVVMMFLALFRGENVGSDTSVYRSIFINIISNPDYANASRYELGYIFLNKLVGKFTTNPQGIIICAALIYYPIYIWFIRKHTKNYALALIFFYVLCFGSTLNILRQELAIAFLLIAYDRMINKRTLLAYFWIIIAFLFHKSAIIFVLVPIMPRIKFNYIFAIILSLAVITLTATNGLAKIVGIIAPRYAFYFNSELYEGSGSISVTYQIIRDIIFFIIAVLVIRKIKDNKVVGESRLKPAFQNNLALWLLFIPAVGAIFGYRIVLIDRIITYFSTFYVILIPNALKKYDKNSKNVLSFLIVAIMTIYTILGTKYRPEWNVIYPYTFFWQ